MDENKNFDNLEETANETAEEVVEEITEAVEEVVEEIAEEAEETTNEVAEIAEEVAKEVMEPESIKKGSKIGAIIAVVVAIVVIAAAVLTSVIETNKYNKMGYVDISGLTVQDILDQQGMSLEDFLAMYDLPADMPADTTEAAAFYNIPMAKMAEMNGTDFVTLKEALKFPETVTEDTPWGVAEGELKLKDYIGDNLDRFKEQYGLGDEVTGETQWKEVRTVVDMAQKKIREEQQAAMKEAANNPAEPVEDEAEAPAEDAAEVPAEGEVAAE